MIKDPALKEGDTKRVLFIGVTKYNLEKDVHLRKKFEGLAQGMKPYVLAKGKMTIGKNLYGTEFYLLPPNIFFWPIALKLAFWLCLFKKIDVIVAQSPLMEGFTGTILKKIFGRELIVEIHGDWLEGPFLSKKRKCEFIQRKAVPILAKISLGNADKIRGVAEYLVESAKKIAPGKKYFIFHTFTDLTPFLSEENIKFEPFILFVGYLQKVKGVKYLIEAFSKIAGDFPNFKLVIVGNGPDAEELKELSSDLGIENRVVFKGKLSLNDTQAVMRNCYCLVLPSLSEGLPRVIMEAMASRKPVIASNVGGIPELIKDEITGFIFNPANPDDLAEKLKRLLSNSELAIKMGKDGGKIAVAKFSNANYLESYFKMIEQ